MALTDDELDYLRSQPLARLATVAPDGQRHPGRPRGRAHDAVGLRGGRGGAPAGDTWYEARRTVHQRA